jgi:hypothetical protein
MHSKLFSDVEEEKEKKVKAKATIRALLSFSNV